MIALIDSGATTSMIDYDAARQADLTVESCPTVPELRDFGGNKIDIIGVTKLLLGGFTYSVYVTPTHQGRHYDLLVGMNILSSLSPFIVTHNTVYLLKPNPILRFKRIDTAKEDHKSAIENLKDDEILPCIGELFAHDEHVHAVQKHIMESDSPHLDSSSSDSPSLKIVGNTTEIDSLEFDHPPEPLSDPLIEKSSIPNYAATASPNVIMEERTKILQALDRHAENADFSPPNKERLRTLLHSFADVFVFDLAYGAQATVPPLHISLKPDTPLPPPTRTSGIPVHLHSHFYECIKKLIDAKIIRRVSHAPTVTRAFFVNQANGPRLVVDYRGLNKCTVFTHESIPAVKDVLNSVGRFRLFSKLDLRQAYYQVPLDEASQLLTAFRGPNGELYAWTGSPMGLSNLPGAFQQIVNTVFADYLGVFVLAELDDILIGSDSDEESHLRYLELALTRIRKYNLKVSVKKCSFATKSMKYLGQVVQVDSQGDRVEIKPDPARVFAIRTLSKPTTVRQLRALLGLFNYIAWYIPNASSVTAPLFSLLHGSPTSNANVEWNESADSAFKRMHEILHSDLVVVAPTANRPFTLITDASSYALGAVLGQSDEQGRFRVVRYGSKLLHGAQLNYSATEKEALAVIYFLNEYRSIIGFNRTIVLTDHSALVPVFTKMISQSARLQRWTLTVSDMDFVIRYIPGLENPADVLSRLNPPLVNHVSVVTLAKQPGVDKDDSTAQIEKTTAVENRDAFTELPIYTDKELRLLQRQDPNCKTFIDFLSGRLDPESPKERKKLIRKTSGMQLFKGLLIRVQWAERIRAPHSRHLLVLPHKLRDRVLNTAHGQELGHRGVVATYNLITSRYWWPTVRKDVRAFVLSCHTCQLYTQKRPNSAASGSMGVEYPMHTVQIDFIGPLVESDSGYRYIFTIVERCTRFAFAVAAKQNTSEVAAQALLRFCYLFGFPKQVISDRGSHFTGSLFKYFSTVFNITLKNVTAYHPQANGRIERFNGTLIDHLQRMLYGRNPQLWDMMLDAAVFAYNISVHRVTQDSPYFLFTGRDPILPIDSIIPIPTVNLHVDSSATRRDLVEQRNRIVEHVKEQERLTLQTQRQGNANGGKIRTGDLVLLYREDKHDSEFIPAKFQSSWKSLYRVIRCNDRVAEIQNVYRPQEKDIVSISRLKPYVSAYSDQNTFTSSDGSYIVERILDARGPANNREYLVQWSGYRDRENSWLPVSEVPKSILDQYGDSVVKTLPLKEELEREIWPTIDYIPQESILDDAFLETMSQSDSRTDQPVSTTHVLPQLMENDEQSDTDVVEKNKSFTNIAHDESGNEPDSTLLHSNTSSVAKEPSNSEMESHERRSSENVSTSSNILFETTDSTSQPAQNVTENTRPRRNNAGKAPKDLETDYYRY